MLDELAFVLGIPLLLFLGCGAIQGFLAARLKGEIGRTSLGLLPLGCFVFLLITLWGYYKATGWDGLIWMLAILWAACACVGTALGWLTGHLIKRRRDRDVPKKNSPLDPPGSCNAPKNSV